MPTRAILRLPCGQIVSATCASIVTTATILPTPRPGPLLRRSHKVAARPRICAFRDVTTAHDDIVSRCIAHCLVMAGPCGTVHGAGLSVSPRQDDRAVRRRRADRHLYALARRGAAQIAQGAVRDGEPAGRRNHHRHRRGGKISAGRLHAVDDLRDADDDRNARPKQAVQAAARFRTGCGPAQFRTGHGRTPLGAGEHGQAGRGPAARRRRQ